MITKSCKGVGEHIDDSVRAALPFLCGLKATVIAVLMMAAFLTAFVKTPTA